MDSDGLALAFDSDVDAGIRMCESWILKDMGGGLDDFLGEVASGLPMYVCNRAWNKATLVFSCQECMDSVNGCICLQCLLNGNHEGHHVVMMVSDAGTCDCGHVASCKRQGFCRFHAGEISEPHVRLFGKECADKYVEMFCACFANLSFYASRDCKTLTKIISWVSKFAGAVEAFKRCVAIAFFSGVDAHQFLYDMAIFNKASVHVLMDFFRSMICDQYFLLHFAKAFFTVTPRMTWVSLHAAIMKDRETIGRGENFLRFGFHCLEKSTLNEIHESGFDWKPVIIGTLSRINAFSRTNCTEAYWKSANAYDYMEYLRILMITVGHVIGNSVVPDLLGLLANYELESQFERLFDAKESMNEMHVICGRLAWYHSCFVCSLCKKQIDARYVFMFLRDVIVRKLCTPDSWQVVPLEMRSPLMPGVQISQELAIHQTLGLILRDRRPHSKDFFLDLCGTDNNVDDMCVLMATAPLRLFAAGRLIEFGMFPMNCDNLKVVMELFACGSAVTTRLMPLFGLIQMLLGICADKNRFLYNIAAVFGVFMTDMLDEEEHSSVVLSFLFIICCMVFDRHFFADDSSILVQLFGSYITSILLKTGTMNSDDLRGKCMSMFIEMDDCDSVLDAITSIKETSSGNVRLLRGDREFHFYYPWMSHKCVLQIAAHLLDKCANGILPFPELSVDPESLTLNCCVVQPVTLGICYYVVSEHVHETTNQQIASVHTVLNILIAAYRQSERPLIAVELQWLSTGTIEDLIRIMPTVFNEFWFLPISFKGRDALSMNDMIKKCPSASSVMKTLGLVVATAMPHDDREERKNRARIARENALNAIQRNARAIVTTESMNAIECVYCHTEKCDAMCFPVFLATTSVPSFMMNATGDSTVVTSCLAVSACSHIVHSHCCKVKKTGFRCTICKCRKSGMLPILRCEFKGSPTKEEKPALRSFFRLVEETMDDGVDGVLSALNGLTGLLQAVEIRQRTNDSCLERENLWCLVKPLFCAINASWHNCKDQKKIDETSELARFIVSLIGVPNTADAFRTAAMNRNVSLIFARQVALFGAFVFSNQYDVQWHAVMNVSTIHTLASPLPQWKIDLPQRFYDLARQSPGLPLEDQTESLGYCLLSKQLVALGESQQYVTLEKLIEHVCHGVTLVIVLSGKFVTAMYTVFGHPGLTIRQEPSVYRTADGNSDIGLRGMLPLTLNNRVLDRYVDGIVTGDWMARP